MTGCHILKDGLMQMPMSLANICSVMASLDQYGCSMTPNEKSLLLGSGRPPYATMWGSYHVRLLIWVSRRPPATHSMQLWMYGNAIGVACRLGISVGC